MATLTIPIDPELLQAAKLEAQRRHISLDQMVNKYLTAVAHPSPSDTDMEELKSLMDEGRIGVIARPLTREEIYAERT